MENKPQTPTTVREKLGKAYLTAGVATTALVLANPAFAEGTDPMQPIYDKLKTSADGISGAQMALYGVLIMIIGGLLAWAYFKRVAK